MNIERNGNYVWPAADSGARTARGWFGRASRTTLPAQLDSMRALGLYDKCLI